MTVFQMYKTMEKLIEQGYEDRQIIDEKCERICCVFPPYDEDAQEVMLQTGKLWQHGACDEICPECGATAVNGKCTSPARHDARYEMCEEDYKYNTICDNMLN
jgi:hypothetical protein